MMVPFTTGKPTESEFSRRPCSRRRFLAATAGLGASSFLSGCAIGSQSENAGRTSPTATGSDSIDQPTGPVENPTPASETTPREPSTDERSAFVLPQYLSWVFAPGFVSEAPNYQVLYYDHQRTAEVIDHIPRSLDREFDRGGPHWANVEIGFTDVQYWLVFRQWLGQVFVVDPTAWDPGAVQLSLAENGYRPKATHGDVIIMWKENAIDARAARAYGIGSDFAVVGQAPHRLDTPSAVETVKRILDAKEGTSSRLVQSNSGVREVARLLGEPDTWSRIEATKKAEKTRLGFDQIAGVVAKGWNWNIRGSQTDIRVALTYDSSRDVDIETLSSWVDSHDQLRMLRDLDIVGRERSVTLSGTVGTKYLEETP